MLKTLRDSPYKSVQTTKVEVEKMTLFEIFIRMFVDEVTISEMKEQIDTAAEVVQMVEEYLNTQTTPYNS